MGFELMTSSLPRMRSTPELHRHSLERGRRIELPFPAWKAGIIAIIRTPRSGTPLRCGQGWIRTTEGITSRFTVCPIWPLWSLPDICLYALRQKRADGRIRTVDPEITNHVLWPAELHRQLCQCPFPQKRTANIGNFWEKQKSFYKISEIFFEIPSASIPHSFLWAA